MRGEGRNEGGSWYRYDPRRQRLSLTLHVQPNAPRSCFAGLHGDALKVKIAAPATDNAANAELVRFLSEALGVPRAAIDLKQGARNRRKVMEIGGGRELEARIARLATPAATSEA